MENTVLKKTDRINEKEMSFDQLLNKSLRKR